MPKFYEDTYFAVKNRKDMKDIQGWVAARCVRDPLANFALAEVYARYCQDAGRLPWPAAGAVSVALFSRALAGAGIERRKASITRVVGLRPVGM